MDFLLKNKEWILSGIVAFVIGFIANYISNFLKKRISRNKKYKVTNIEESRNVFKDPYIFEFLNIDDNAIISDSENDMVKYFTNYIIENNSDFALIGREYSINIGSSRLLIDLVLYNKKLNSFLIFEFKRSKYRIEHRNQLQQYLEYFDRLVKKENDEKSIGILICYSEDKIEIDTVLNEKTIEFDELLKSIDKLKIQLEDAFNKQRNANKDS